jgi:hypothetical protein
MTLQCGVRGSEGWSRARRHTGVKEMGDGTTERVAAVVCSGFAHVCQPRASLKGFGVVGKVLIEKGGHV